MVVYQAVRTVKTLLSTQQYSGRADPETLTEDYSCGVVLLTCYFQYAAGLGEELCSALYSLYVCVK